MIDKLIQYRQEKLKGRENGIPINIQALGRVIPHLLHGEYNCITANSSVGKTTIAKSILAFEPVAWVLSQNDWDIRVYWYALEENKEEFELSLMQFLLNKHYGISVEQNELLSAFKPLSEELLHKIESLKDIFDQYMQKIIVIDDILNPTGILYSFRKEISKIGSWVRKDGSIVEEINQDTGLPNSEEYLEFKYNSKILPVVVIDHVSNLEVEKDKGEVVKMSLHDTMKKWSYYARKVINKHFNAAVWNVHQQAAAQEGIEYLKTSKQEPSLNGLADNKTIGRDYQRVIGVYSPYRYEQEKFLGYDIKTKMQDYFRSLSIIKNRMGKANVKIPCYFDPLGYDIRSLPPPNNEELMKKVYERVDILKKIN